MRTDLENLTINLSIEENGNIILKFGPEDSINIDISGDVDLSDYVSKLTFLIDQPVNLILNKFESEDAKINLVQNTLEDIANSFNKGVNDSQSSDSDAT